MIENLSTIAVAVISSVTTTSLLGLGILSLVKKWLDTHFDARLETIKLDNSTQLARLSAELEMMKHARNLLLQKRVDYYPHIMATLYRTVREIEREVGTREKSRADGKGIEELRSSVDAHLSELSTICYENRILLTEPLFEQVHSFKKIVEAVRTSLTVAITSSGSIDIEPQLHECLSKLNQRLETIAKGLREETSGQ